MARFAGMHEERGRAGAGQGGGDFTGNMAGFSHSRHDDAAAAVKTNAAGACKIRPQTRQLRAQSVDFDLQRLAAEVDEIFVGVVEMHPPNDTADAESRTLRRKLEQYLRCRYESTAGSAIDRGGLGRR